MAQAEARSGRAVSPLAIDIVELVIRLAAFERELSPQRRRELQEAVSDRLERYEASRCAGGSPGAGRTKARA